MKTNKPTKTCSFPSGTLMSQIERILPLLQIVCVLPMKCFCCRHVILSLQTHDYFQDRYFIISRNNDMGLILLHSYFWEELSHKNQECPLWSCLPLLISFPPLFAPPPHPNSGSLDAPSFSVFSVCLCISICSHLCLTNIHIDLFFF